MIADWQWVEREEALAIHQMQIERYGGSEGIRDEGIPDSALGRPKNLSAYENVGDPALLAAAYANGIAKNHRFVDGNKRTAFIVAAFFLRVSGYNMTALETDVVKIVLGLAAGSITENEFGEWLRGAMQPVEA